jgi:hypothetical protein
MKKREKKTGNKFVLYNKSLTFAPLSTESLCVFETIAAIFAQAERRRNLFSMLRRSQKSQQL